MSRLAPVPNSPNCVSSRCDPKDAGHFIAPLTSTSLDAVRRVMAAQPRTELVEDTGDYLHYVCTTRLFRFKDDVEFEVDGDLVHVRSASRLGYGDLGVNRKRVEALRAALR